MRRVRKRRRRIAAFALLPLAALTATTMLTTAFAATPAASGSARIDASARTVTFGEKVSLRGAFPGAANAPLEISHRARGSRNWRAVRQARTGADGRYAVRVRPRASGHWHATLAAEPVRQAGADGATAEGSDTSAGTAAPATPGSRSARAPAPRSPAATRPSATRSRCAAR